MSQEPKLVLYSKEDAIVHVKLNRPESLNAFNPPLLLSLIEAFKKAEADDDVKVVIVSGEGRAFSAGVDLKTTPPEEFRKAAKFMKTGEELPRVIQNMTKVMIAQVHGYCFTGALELALMFDLCYCDDNTQFGDTHAKWGIMPRWGMTQRLARRIGLIRAKELTFRALRVKGAEAERIGLVNKSFAAGELSEGVMTVAREITANSHEAIVAIKKLYDEGYHTTLGEGLEIEKAADIAIGELGDNLKQFDKKKFKG